MNPNLIQNIGLFVLAYLAVFVAAVDNRAADVLGVQIDFLPGLMVYAGLNVGWGLLTALAILSGLWFDALSANPLGISILPLFAIAFVLRWNHELILKDDPYAQFVLGSIATATVPVLTLLLLWGTGQKPLLGWGTFAQWLIHILIGGGLTPVCFWSLQRIHRAFSYPQMAETSFRSDREIKRGRA